MGTVLPGSDVPEPITRRTFVRRAGGTVLGASFLSLLDGVAPARPAVTSTLPLEQHLDLGDRISTDNGVEIVVSLLYHEIVTARLTTAPDGPALLAVRAELEHALRSIEAGLVAGPSGLLATVAWGVPYFRSHLTRLRDGRRFPRYLPVDLEASRRVDRRVPALVDAYGERYDVGTALVQRADFNTLDNPFSWTSDERADRWHAEPAAGLHFVSFTATASFFERGRRAMDAHYPNGKGTGFDPRDAELGLNSVLHTTPRQNFLAPPRARRSFPLAELV